METKFTPGPWVTADSHGPLESGTSVQSTHDQWLVATTTGYYGRDTQIANARLIAAAPDMLEVLLRIYSFGDLNGEDYDAVRDVIAKATGGAE